MSINGHQIANHAQNAHILDGLDLDMHWAPLDSYRDMKLNWSLKNSVHDAQKGINLNVMGGSVMDGYWQMYLSQAQPPYAKNGFVNGDVQDINQYGAIDIWQIPPIIPITEGRGGTLDLFVNLDQHLPIFAANELWTDPTTPHKNVGNIKANDIEAKLKLYWNWTDQIIPYPIPPLQLTGTDFNVWDVLVQGRDGEEANFPRTGMIVVRLTQDGITKIQTEYAKLASIVGLIPRYDVKTLTMSGTTRTPAENMAITACVEILIVDPLAANNKVEFIPKGYTPFNPNANPPVWKPSFPIIVDDMYCYTGMQDITLQITQGVAAAKKVWSMSAHDMFTMTVTHNPASTNTDPRCISNIAIRSWRITNGGWIQGNVANIVPDPIPTNTQHLLSNAYQIDIVQIAPFRLDQLKGTPLSSVNMNDMFTAHAWWLDGYHCTVDLNSNAFKWRYKDQLLARPGSGDGGTAKWSAVLASVGVASKRFPNGGLAIKDLSVGIGDATSTIDIGKTIWKSDVYGVRCSAATYSGFLSLFSLTSPASDDGSDPVPVPTPLPAPVPTPLPAPVEATTVSGKVPTNLKAELKTNVYVKPQDLSVYFVEDNIKYEIPHSMITVSRKRLAKNKVELTVSLLENKNINTVLDVITR
jgi:hypothetical protein